MSEYRKPSPEETRGPADKVAIFRPYPFKVGQKIFIAGGPRGGDWEVIGLGLEKIRLRCPVSHREVEWVSFCYLVEEKAGEPWPHRD
ncbi:MAG: hypothetical protein ACOZF2_18760 [Thermodesulfobacteriota bacterium]